MAAWELGLALAAGSCVVLTPAEQTPTSTMALRVLLSNEIPPDVGNVNVNVHVVTGFGAAADEALAASGGSGKFASTGSMVIGKREES